MTSEPETRAWFSIRELKPGIFVILEPNHTVDVKSYLVVGERRAVLIDTGTGVGDFHGVVRGLTELPLTVVQSHAHWDHVGSTAAFIAEAEIWIHSAEAEDLAAGVDNAEMRQLVAPEQLLGPLPPDFDLATAEIRGVTPTRLLAGGERIDLGGRVLEVIHAPGHSPGSVVLLDRANGVLFSTDVAYADPLYAQLDGSDLAAYRTTLAALAALAADLRVVYPAHGPTPISPSLLPPMATALAEVARGREPDSFHRTVAVHQFEGFSVLAPAPPSAEVGLK